MLKTLLSLLLTLFLSYQVFSTTVTIQVLAQTFNPSSVSVTVGDTILWQWVVGTHTTTSTVVPAGATTWNAPIDAGNQTFRYRVGVAGNYSYHCIPHSGFGMTGTILANPFGVKQISSEVPVRFELYQNFPNPFNPVTNIRFDLAKSGNVKLIVFDALGREVETPVNGSLAEGSYNVDWDASAYTSGLYFYVLLTSDYAETKKMLLLK